MKMPILKLIWFLSAFLLGATSWAEFGNTSLGFLLGWSNLNNGGGSLITYQRDLRFRNGFLSPGVTYNTLTPNTTTVGTANYSQGYSNLYFHLELTLGNLGVGGLGGINWWNNNTP